MPIAEANGIRLHYHFYGEGAPVLWIQGLGADHSAWGAQVNAFRHRFQCVVFDNRDVGHSQQVSAEYAVADMAEDAAALLKALDLPAAHVVGLSMGGAIAQELALRYPDKVRALALVSSTAAPDARLRQIVTTWADCYAKLGAVDFYRQGLAWLYSYRFFERPRAVPAMLRYVANHPQAPDAFARQAAASLRHDTVARLPEIRVPALVIAGEEDILVPARLSRTLAAGIPGARWTVIPAAGHAVNVEQVVAFNRVLAEFWERT